jgi:hypothetical protein
MDTTQVGTPDAYVPIAGAAFFGLVVGWMAHRVFEGQRTPNVSWLGSMIGVIGGGAVTALFGNRTMMFGAYSIGLGIAFFSGVVLRPIGRVFAKFFRREVRREMGE